MAEVVVGMETSLHPGYGPLHYAALHGKVEMCKFLIKDLKFEVDTTEAFGNIFAFLVQFGWLVSLLHGAGCVQKWVVHWEGWVGPCSLCAALCNGRYFGLLGGELLGDYGDDW